MTGYIIWVIGFEPEPKKSDLILGLEVVLNNNDGTYYKCVSVVQTS